MITAKIVVENTGDCITLYTYCLRADQFRNDEPYGDGAAVSPASRIENSYEQPRTI